MHTAEYRYQTVDVFTDTLFGGNQLAVFPEAEGLEAAEMQAIAAEFNYSETTFVLPPDDPAHTARVRIFTPQHELPFAGHPNVGTAFVLARLGVATTTADGDGFAFEEKAGLVRVELMHEEEIVGATLTAPQGLEIGRAVPVEAVAACVGLAPADFATDPHPPIVASVGLPFVFARLTDRGALTRARPQSAAFERHLPADLGGLHLYARDSAGEVDLRTRMFAPLHGIVEDPATGSANAALAGLLAARAPEPDLSLTLRIAQGVEMGRPSLLHASVTKAKGAIEAIRIGGRCVQVMEGTLFLERAGAPRHARIDPFETA